MDSNGDWYWANIKPILCTQDKKDNIGYWYSNTVDEYSLKAFDIAPADDWTKSLIKVGGNECELLDLFDLAILNL